MKNENFAVSRTFQQQSVAIEAIASNPDIDTTQTRAKLSHNLVSEYVESMRDGEQFPLVTLFFDGERYWIADGFHRIAAQKKLGYKEIYASVARGGYREAVLHGVKANSNHGLRPSQKDKRAAVMKILTEGDTFNLSLRATAALCGVSHTYVQNLQQELADRTERAQSEESESDAIMPVSGRDATGKAIPEELISLFQYSDTLRGYAKALSVEVKGIAGLYKDTEREEGEAMEVFRENLRDCLEQLRQAIRMLKLDVAAFATEYANGAPCEPDTPYITERMYKGNRKAYAENGISGKISPKIAVTDTTDVDAVFFDDEEKGDWESERTAESVVIEGNSVLIDESIESDSDAIGSDPQKG